MAAKNIVLTNGSVSETTYNADKIDAQLATARAVTGNSTFNGNVAVTGNETVGGTLAVTGATTLTGDVTAGGGLNVTGDLSVTGDVGPLENIVDEDGNKRFQDFSISFVDTYGSVFKGIAGLSGKVLTIAGNIDLNGLTSSIPANSILATITIPSWLGNKIIIWGNGNTFIRHFSIYDESDSGASIVLFRPNATTLTIRSAFAEIAQLSAKSISFEINLII